MECDPRGRKKILTPEELHAMEKVIWKFGFEARALSWQGLAYKVGIITDMSYRTI